MTVKHVVSGKHPMTIRVTDEDYKMLRMAAAESNESVNEMIVRLAVECVRGDAAKKAD